MSGKQEDKTFAEDGTRPSESGIIYVVDRIDIDGERPITSH